MAPRDLVSSLNHSKSLNHDHQITTKSSIINQIRNQSHHYTMSQLFMFLSVMCNRFAIRAGAGAVWIFCYRSNTSVYWRHHSNSPQKLLRIIILNIKEIQNKKSGNQLYTTVWRYCGSCTQLYLFATMCRTDLWCVIYVTFNWNECLQLIHVTWHELNWFFICPIYTARIM